MVIEGVTPIRTAGAQVPVPIASLAKMMTAYLILRDHPLTGADQGPSLTIDSDDIETLDEEEAVQGSVLAVQAGETLSERQALEALLIPSADNIAQLLARWDAGSVSAFVTKMNSSAQALGLQHTTYTDPSGLAATTVSTAQDQLLMATAAMNDAVFGSIVAMPSATFPVAGTVFNFNHDVGHFGIVGVKTGSDSQAQGCWAFAAARTVAGAPHAVFGVVLGIQGTSAGLIVPALAAGLALANAVPDTVRQMTLLPAGTVVGYVNAPWRAPIPIRTTSALRGFVQAGSTVPVQVALARPAGSSVQRGNALGAVSVTGVHGASRSQVKSAGSGGGPSLWWRLTRS